MTLMKSRRKECYQGYCAGTRSVR